MEVYLDNSATTRAYPEVGNIVYKVMCQDYGNPSSMHRKGVEAEHYVKDAKEILAKLLKVNAKEIFFTSGGTESDNLALIGAARANRRRGNHLITSSIEHPAILNTMHYLEEEEGFRVTYLPVDENGRVRLEALKEALCQDTILVSIMYVNNEVGSVQPIEEAVKIVKNFNPRILFHSDAVQGFGKYHIYPKRVGIDMLSASGHKIHGPKGTGFLYINEKVKIKPIIFGGEQQKNIRSGTENVPGIAGLGLAAKMIYQDLNMKVSLMRELKAHFIEGISKIEHATVHGLTDENSAPHIISVGIAGVRSEVLLHTLEDKGIYVSSGSACASNHPAISGVLRGIGTSQEYLDSTLRFSMSEFTTKEEIDYTLETLYNCVPMLRRYTRH
ncbi:MULTISPECIES: cysteine desulfurase family protein [Clostridia]|uniref:Cysteine desulfurase n=1 Tax=Ruminococcus hominis TaxID=2763065 RepID=A0ABR7G8A5_9FIRM|nr:MULTISPECIES: cysteine desulfurase family protein [Clostridia]MBC5683678.1 cysteine desulfurase [Ruminococcus hominis]MCH4280260.1 cysteine desulfurase [Mediterraneibacter sp. NSJ-151]RHS80386.1 cysteine desulfurase [Firmicutes bacterium AM43-11BH]RHT38608.1 cysteine desulfurase [Firmicutes bacterium AM31-12AC]